MLKHSVLVVVCTLALMQGTAGVFLPKLEMCEETTGNLRAKFEKSCSGNLFSRLECQSLWHAFSGAFAHKDPAGIKPE